MSRKQGESPIGRTPKLNKGIRKSLLKVVQTTAALCHTFTHSLVVCRCYRILDASLEHKALPSRHSLLTPVVHAHPTLRVGHHSAPDLREPKG